MSKPIVEMTADELGDIISKAVAKALDEHYLKTDERAKKADEIRKRLLTE